jgi:bla regulator protein BlaR1
VLLLVISVGVYFLFKPSTTSPPNEADINAIYQVVGEFGARLKDVDLSAPKQDILTAVGFNLRQLITSRLYEEFVQDTSRIPGRYVSSPWPERIQIDSVQRLDSGSYTVNGNQIMMDSDALAHGGNAGRTLITLTLKKVNGTWLIDDVVGGTQPKA